MTDSKDFLKWNNVSSEFGCSNNTIRKNKIPSQYKSKVDELIKMVDKWRKSIK